MFWRLLPTNFSPSPASSSRNSFSLRAMILSECCCINLRALRLARFLAVIGDVCSCHAAQGYQAMSVNVICTILTSLWRLASRGGIVKPMASIKTARIQGADDQLASYVGAFKRCHRTHTTSQSRRLGFMKHVRKFIGALFSMILQRTQCAKVVRKA